MEKEDLPTYLTNAGVLHSPHIVRAFQIVDRADFVLPEFKDLAHEDHPLPIGHGQSISQPSTVAFMLELLAPKKNNVVLDLGTGAGWTSALLAESVGPKGMIYTVEVLSALVLFAQTNLLKYHYQNVHIKHATSRLGLPEFSPFEKILVSAAANELPATLVDQLASGGTLVMPIQETIVKVDKVSDTALEIRSFPGFAFVPLKY